MFSLVTTQTKGDSFRWQKFQNMEQGRQAGGERRVARGRIRGRQRREKPRPVVSDEIRATIDDHVVNHGLSLREAGLRVQPNLERSTVASIVWIFRQRILQ